MPFCSQCGEEVRAADRFCGVCGTAQPGASGAAFASAASRGNPADNLSPRGASSLCYIPLVGWIACLFVLASNRFRQMRTVRFHAFQGLYLFVTWLIVDLIVDNSRWMLPDGTRWLLSPLRLAVIGAWIYTLVQTANDRLVKLPLLGEIAERSVDEQR